MTQNYDKTAEFLNNLLNGGGKMAQMLIPVGQLFAGFGKNKNHAMALGKLLELERKFNKASKEKHFENEDKRSAYLAYYLFQYVFEEKDEPEVILPKDFEEKVQ